MTADPFSARGVIEALRRQPGKSAGAGRVAMVMAARRGEGVSTVALAAARAAAPDTTYAIDLDLRRNTFARALTESGEELGPPISGALNNTLFFDVHYPAEALPAVRRAPYRYHRVGRTRLYTGAFDNAVAEQGGRVQISSLPDYWNAVRAGGATAIVDAPALERSQLGLRVAKHMDGVVLVVAGDAGAAPAAMAARAEILAAGGALLGIVYTRANPVAVTLDRLWSRAS